jgi:protein ImuB
MLWLALSFPQLALEVFTERLVGHDRAVIVLQDNRVRFSNDVAQAANIAVGSSLATAHTIDADLIHFHRDPQAEDKRLHRLADMLYRFSDHVSVQLPDCVLIEIGGSLRLFGSHQALCDAAIELCTELGHLSIGRCATTPWAAIALARSQQQHLIDVPLKAAGLELAKVPAQIIERFANMGIYTLGPLLELPSTELGKRFGPALLLYLEQLTGNIGDPRIAITPAPSFTREIHLLQPISDKEVLFASQHSPMQTLARELQHWLIAHQLGCERLEWQFATASTRKPGKAASEKGAPEKVYVPVRFARSKQNQAEFRKVSELRLENVALPEEVLTVGLSAKRLTAWHNTSENLFKIAPATNTSDTSDATVSQNPRGNKNSSQIKLDGRAAELIDELCARLGDSACRGVQDIVQHTPESAWSQVTTHQLLRPTQSAKTENLVLDTGKRPLWLFNPPRRVLRNELHLTHGPERIQTQWWFSTTCRDYYIAQHSNGAECWAYVDDDAHWYLHGYFA